MYLLPCAYSTYSARVRAYIFMYAAAPGRAHARWFYIILVQAYFVTQACSFFGGFSRHNFTENGLQYLKIV
jgi:hypothetical protein